MKGIYLKGVVLTVGAAKMEAFVNLLESQEIIYQVNFARAFYSEIFVWVSTQAQIARLLNMIEKL